MQKNNPRKTEQARDRVLGCVVGGAVGDALGYAVEFVSWPRIRSRYGERGITRYELDRRGLAPISDDTQMSLFTASGIVFGLTRGYMRGIMARIDLYCHWTYVDWLHTQEWPSRQRGARVDSWLMDVPELYARRAPGNTCLSALHALEKDHKPENDSCGCGGVMRTAPVALLTYIHRYAAGDVAYCDMCAAETARLTHKHPLGFLPSAVLNRVLWKIQEGGVQSRADLRRTFMDAAAALKEVVSEPDGHKTYGELFPKDCATMERIISSAMSKADSGIPDVEAIEQLGGGWTGHEALAIAAFSAVRHYGSFEDSVVSAVNHSGDSDSTGAICGNIAGCLYGRRAIPAYYTEKLELLPVLEEIAEDLYTGCNISEYMERETPEEKRWFDKYCMHHWTPLEHPDSERRNDTEDREARVRDMSETYDKLYALSESLSKKLEELGSMSSDVEKLKEYLSSGEWLRDYEADERGEISQEINRSVLSQDGLYDLLENLDDYYKFLNK